MVTVKIVVFWEVSFGGGESIHTSQLPLTSELPQEVVHRCVEGYRLSSSGSSRIA
jgi:hypothetical protein